MGSVAPRPISSKEKDISNDDIERVRAGKVCIWAADLLANLNSIDCDINSRAFENSDAITKLINKLCHIQEVKYAIMASQVEVLLDGDCVADSTIVRLGSRVLSLYRD